MKRYVGAVVLFVFFTLSFATNVNVAGASTTTTTTTEAYPVASTMAGYVALANGVCGTVEANQVSIVEGLPDEGLNPQASTASSLSGWALGLKESASTYQQGQIALRAVAALAGESAQYAGVWSKGDVIVNSLQTAQQAAAKKNLSAFRSAIVKVKPAAAAAQAAAQTMHINCYADIDV